jgi:hypothetical protein
MHGIRRGSLVEGRLIDDPPGEATAGTAVMAPPPIPSRLRTARRLIQHGRAAPEPVAEPDSQQPDVPDEQAGAGRLDQQGSTLAPRLIAFTGSRVEGSIEDGRWSAIGGMADHLRRGVVPARIR